MSQVTQYNYIFDDIGPGYNNVSIRNSSYIGEKNILLMLNDDHFLNRRSAYISPVMADMLDIAVAVFTADRFSTRHKNHTHREINIEIPLRCPEIFSKDNIISLLKEVLNYYSHDVWNFQFHFRQSQGRISEIQGRLGIYSDSVEVALWSGGLDSLAGLCTRLDMNVASTYTLIGTGLNRTMQGVQKRTANEIKRLFSSTEINFMHIPIYYHNIDRVFPNRSPRTRGFLFLVIGAVSAHIEQQNVVSIYENGVGAINLPYIKSSTGLDHSRAVNPISLCYMSKLLSEVLSEKFIFRNPFLLWTKAQMCNSIIENSNEHLVSLTVTCDRRRRASYIQCGRCSSCLLRRQSLLVCGIDETDYFVPMALKNGQRLRASDGDFLRVMLRQVDTLRWCLNSENPWQSLSLEFPSLPPVVWWLADLGEGEQNNLQENLVGLYRDYVTEWDTPDVRYLLSRGLLLDSELQDHNGVYGR